MKNFIASIIGIICLICCTSIMTEPTVEEPKNEYIYCVENDYNTKEQSYTKLITLSPMETKEPIYLGRFLLTAYCSCPQCCGIYAYNRPIDEYGNEIVYTATGARAIEGYTIAVDPNVIPYGSEVIIDGHVYCAQDCGGGIKGNHIDVYFGSHHDALNFAMGYYDVYLDN